jgi:hypothetical protein
MEAWSRRQQEQLQLESRLLALALWQGMLLRWQLFLAALQQQGVLPRRQLAATWLQADSRPSTRRRSRAGPALRFCLLMKAVAAVVWDLAKALVAWPGAAALGSAREQPLDLAAWLAAGEASGAQLALLAA